MANDPDDYTKGPLPGTWAYTARMMAEMFPDEDWDRWKDEQKDREMYEQLEREQAEK